MNTPTGLDSRPKRRNTPKTKIQHVRVPPDLHRNATGSPPPANLGGLIGGTGMSLDPALETAVRRGRQLRNHSPRTADMDVWLLTALGKPAAEATVDDLTAIILRNQKQTSRFTYWAHLRSLFKMLRADGLIPKDCVPDLELPHMKRPKRSPRPFSVNQLERLRAKMRPPWRDVVVIASLTGLRASELWALEGRHLVHGVHGPEIEVTGKGDKHAFIPAHPTVVEIIDSYGTLGRLWPRWSTPVVLSRMVNAEIRRVLGTGTLHQARHSFGTQLLAATDNLAVVQQLMRHSDMSSTLIYAELASDKGRQAIDLLAG